MIGFIVRILTIAIIGLYYLGIILFMKSQGRKFKTVFSILVVVASIAGAMFTVKTALNLQPKYFKQFFKISSIESFENKLTVLLTTGYYLAIYLLVTELAVMSYRFLSSNPD